MGNNFNRYSSQSLTFEGSFPWTPQFPDAEKFAAAQRWVTAQQRYFDAFAFSKKNETNFCQTTPGYASLLRALSNRHKDQRCFVLGNGPSLGKMDLSLLRKEVTIGSNGIYRLFPEWGFHTTYFTMEDVEQVEDRRAELPGVVGPIRIFGLDNSYCVDARQDTLFANVIRYSHPFDVWWKRYYPEFSKDFSACVYLGSTVTYMNLQLAFYLGCNPVYIIGVDHSYGPLQKIFPPGKIVITPEVLKLLESIHCVKSYHKIGGRIGIPYVAEQEQAFRKALATYNEDGRAVFNAGIMSELNVFPRFDFQKLF